MFSQQREQTGINNQEVIRNLRQSANLLARHNLEIVNVGWDDASRAFNSSIGSNISDWSFKLKDGTVLPFIRSPNFTDKTLTISAKDVSLIVGNERPGGDLNAITFQNYLENYGKYTPGVPDKVNLSSGPDELVTIRYIGVIVPENSDGSQEVVPTAYNYQTYSDDNPKNILGASFHMGVGTTTDGSCTKNVYLVKTNSSDTVQFNDYYKKSDDSDSLAQYLDYQENTWFQITNENCESDEQKKAVASVLGTRSTSAPARNRVQCFQIPREQSTPKRKSKGLVPKGLSSLSADSCNESVIYRGLSTGNVSHGSSAGKHTKIKMNYKRDKSQNVTITFAYYFTTKDGNLNNSDISHIATTLQNSYEDVKAKWVGSLVTGEAEQSSKSSKTEPPIKLPELTQNDIFQFNHKVTHFPKSKEDVQLFPI
tara:strand:+ start:746 stop:2020 length:1275 start_codon:yes stop_codon:yes gene_type:complete